MMVLLQHEGRSVACNHPTGRASSHSSACAIGQRALARDIAIANRKRQGSGTCVIIVSG